MPGGDFELNVIKETHYNNDCKNSAAYLAAPILDNFTSWKERWRGTTNHANYVNRNGTGDDTDCGTGTQVAPVRSIDRRNVGTGEPGPVTLQLQELYFNVVQGKVEKYRHWCTPVYAEDLGVGS